MKTNVEMIEHQMNYKFIADYLQLLMGDYRDFKNMYVRLQTRDDNYGYNFKLPLLLNPDTNHKCFKKYGQDGMFTPSTFIRYSEKNKMNYLHTIFAFQIDVDYHRSVKFKEFSPEEMIYLLQEEEFGVSIPTPNFVEYSNNLRLIYLLHPTVLYHNPNGKTLLKRIIGKFVSSLNLSDEYKAEINPLNSYFRIPGSINTKNCSVVRLIEFIGPHYRYELSEFAETWLDELPKWYSEWKEEKINRMNKRTYRPNNIIRLIRKRLEDIETVQEYFNKNHEHSGFRAHLNFLFKNYSLQEQLHLYPEFTALQVNEILDEKLKNFNNQFLTPDNRRGIRKHSNIAVGKLSYKFKNDNFIDALMITKQIALSLNLNCTRSTAVNREVTDRLYYERKLKKEGRNSKQKDISIRTSKTIQYLEEGLNHRQISEKLGVSLKTTQRDINNIKESHKQALFYYDITISVNEFYF